jgi:hypothetical protein
MTVSWGEGWADPPRSIVVMEQDEVVSIGVLDPQGNMIYRVKGRAPLGFDPKRWAGEGNGNG